MPAEPKSDAYPLQAGMKKNDASNLDPEAAAADAHRNVFVACSENETLKGARPNTHSARARCAEELRTAGAGVAQWERVPEKHGSCGMRSRTPNPFINYPSPPSTLG